MFWYYQLLCLDTDIIGDSSSIGREYVIYILSDLPNLHKLSSKMIIFPFYE